MSKCKNCNVELRSKTGFCHECGTSNPADSDNSGKIGVKLNYGFWMSILISVAIGIGVFFLIKDQL